MLSRRRILAAMLAPAGRAFVTAQVIAVESPAPGVARLRLRLPAGYTFEPGQFALLRLPRAFVESWNRRYGTAHGEIARPYSFALSPRRLPETEFFVQHALPPARTALPPGIASTYVHQHLKPGDPLDLSEPMGSLESAIDNSTRPIVLIAGGTGVAPFAGLLDHWFLTGRHSGRPIYLFFGTRTPRELILDRQFRDWAVKNPNFTYVPSASSPITQVFDRYFPGPLDATVLTAGPPPMMEEIKRIARAKGVPAAQIHHDPIRVAP